MGDLIAWCIKNDIDFKMEKTELWGIKWVITLENKNLDLKYMRVFDEHDFVNIESIASYVKTEFEISMKKKMEGYTCDYYRLLDDTNHMCTGVKGMPVVKCDGDKRKCIYYKM